MEWWRWNWVGSVFSEREMNDVVHTIIPYSIDTTTYRELPIITLTYTESIYYLIVFFDCVPCLRALLSPLFNPPYRQHERPLMPLVQLVPIVPTRPIPLVTFSAKLWNPCITSQMHRPKPHATGLPHRSPRRVVRNTKRFSTQSSVIRICHC